MFPSRKAGRNAWMVLDSTSPPSCCSGCISLALDSISPALDLSGCWMLPTELPQDTLAQGWDLAASQSHQ